MAKEMSCRILDHIFGSLVCRLGLNQSSRVSVFKGFERFEMFGCFGRSSEVQFSLFKYRKICRKLRFEIRDNR